MAVTIDTPLDQIRTWAQPRLAQAAPDAPLASLRGTGRLPMAAAAAGARRGPTPEEAALAMKGRAMAGWTAEEKQTFTKAMSLASEAGLPVASSVSPGMSFDEAMAQIPQPASPEEAEAATAQAGAAGADVPVADVAPPGAPPGMARMTTTTDRTVTEKIEEMPHPQEEKLAAEREKTLEKMEQAKRDEGAAAVKLVEVDAKEAEAKAEELAKFQGRLEKAAGEQAVEMAEAFASHKAKRILADNMQLEDYWARRDTGDRVVAALAVFAGRLGTGTGKPNTVLEQLNKDIDRDFEAQKATIALAHERAKQAGQDIKMLDDWQDDRMADINAMNVAALNKIAGEFAGMSAREKIPELIKAQFAAAEAKLRQDAQEKEQKRIEGLRTKFVTRVENAAVGRDEFTPESKAKGAPKRRTVAGDTAQRNAGKMLIAYDLLARNGPPHPKIIEAFYKAKAVEIKMLESKTLGLADKQAKLWDTFSEEVRQLNLPGQEKYMLAIRLASDTVARSASGMAVPEPERFAFEAIVGAERGGSLSASVEKFRILEESLINEAKLSTDSEEIMAKVDLVRKSPGNKMVLLRDNLVEYDKAAKAKDKVKLGMLQGVFKKAYGTDYVGTFSTPLYEKDTP